MPQINLYRPILKKAWNIAWNFRSLWVLGFFATLLSSGGEYEIISRFFFNRTNKGLIGDIISSFQYGLGVGAQNGENIWQNMWGLLVSSPGTMIIAILILALAVVIAVFFIWLSVISQIGLINNILNISKNKKTTINEGIGAGVVNFWPIFWSNAIIKAILFLIFALFGLVVYLFSSGWWQLLIYGVLFVLFIIGILLISAIPKLQIIYIVNQKKKFVEALKLAWNLFKKNWVVILEISAILLIVYVVGMFISAFASIVLTAIPLVIIPLYFPTIVPIAAYLIFGICIALMIIIIIVVASFITTFQWATWTMMFLRITAGNEDSKILRTVQQLYPGVSRK